MGFKVKVQRIDGKIHLKLPNLVSVKDFEDWMNDAPNKKPLQFEELPERWTSAECNEEFEDI